MKPNPRTLSRTVEGANPRPWAWIIFLGPLPMCALTVLYEYKALPPETGPIVTCGVFFGLFGLGMGVQIRRLSRAILGLNGGALLGSGAGWIIETVPSHSSILVLLPFILLAASLGILRGLVWLDPSDRLASFRLGFSLGFLAMAAFMICYVVLALFLVEMFRMRLAGVGISVAVASAAGVSVLLSHMPVIADYK